MRHSKFKVFICTAVVTFLFGTIIPSFVVVVEATENAKAERPADLALVDVPDKETTEFVAEEQKSQEALEVIEAKYQASVNVVDEVESDSEYTLTAKDEEDINKATSEYLKMVGYSPRLRGFGRNWWNSRGFVGGVIDVAFIVLGFGAGAKSASQAMKIIRANRKNITRAIERQLKNLIGITVGNLLSAGLDAVGAISGISLGYAVAWGIDYVDGKRLDGYIWA